MVLKQARGPSIVTKSTSGSASIIQDTSSITTSSLPTTETSDTTAPVSTTTTPTSTTTTPTSTTTTPACSAATNSAVPGSKPASTSHNPAFSSLAAQYPRLDLSLGTLPIGRARVNIGLESGSVKWGRIAQDNGISTEKAGIVHLKFRFAQPRGSWLKRVEMSFEFVTPNESRGGPFVLGFEPKYMYGAPYTIDRTTQKNLDPHAEVMGNSGGLGNISREDHRQMRYRWEFTGHEIADDHLNPKPYSGLMFRWEHQKKGAEVGFERPLFAAVVLEHQARRFDLTSNVVAIPDSRWRRTFARYKGNTNRMPLVPSLSTDDLTHSFTNLDTLIKDKNEQEVAEGM
ncbi:hypothetical protein AALT_g2474 [Alternaria alternata]|nr:hypothetical protein AALT_g2474 [Alternaria alternata]